MRLEVPWNLICIWRIFIASNCGDRKQNFLETSNQECQFASTIYLKPADTALGARCFGHNRSRSALLLSTFCAGIRQPVVWLWFFSSHQRSTKLSILHQVTSKDRHFLLQVVNFGTPVAWLVPFVSASSHTDTDSSTVALPSQRSKWACHGVVSISWWLLVKHPNVSKQTTKQWYLHLYSCYHRLLACEVHVVPAVIIVPSFSDKQMKPGSRYKLTWKVFKPWAFSRFSSVGSSSIPSLFEGEKQSCHFNKSPSYFHQRWPLISPGVVAVTGDPPV